MKKIQGLKDIHGATPEQEEQHDKDDILEDYNRGTKEGFDEERNGTLGVGVTKNVVVGGIESINIVYYYGVEWWCLPHNSKLKNQSREIERERACVCVCVRER